MTTSARGGMLATMFEFRSLFLEMLMKTLRKLMGMGIVEMEENCLN